MSFRNVGKTNCPYPNITSIGNGGIVAQPEILTNPLYGQRNFARNGNSFGFPALKLPSVRARWIGDSAESNGSYFRWNDISGNGHHATHVSAMPTFSTLNGRRTVVGHASGDSRLTISTKHILSGLADFAVFAVVKTPVTFENLQSFIGGSSFGGGDTNVFNIETGGAAYPCYFYMRVVDTTNTERGAYTQTSPGQVTSDAWHSILFNCVSLTNNPYLNGVSSVGNAPTLSGSVILPTTSLYLMGANYAGFYWKGQVAEITIFTRSLDATARTALFAYSTQSYGV